MKVMIYGSPLRQPTRMVAEFFRFSLEKCRYSTVRRIVVVVDTNTRALISMVTVSVATVPRVSRHVSVTSQVKIVETLFMDVFR